jgi:outer membrane protein TolC
MNYMHARKQIILFASLIVTAKAFAQFGADTSVRLKDVVKMAEERYHLLRSSKYEVDAANKGIDVAKQSKLPSLDVTYQAGVATANNITGQVYPYGIIPMTGPPSAENKYDPGTGTAASALLNWQVTNFGQREAEINVAVAQANSKQNEFAQKVFEQKINVISAYLDLLFAYDIVSIHRKNVERIGANLNESRVLAKAGIKPGVDTALFLSELSKARVDLLNGERQLQTSRLLLREIILTAAMPTPIDTGFLNNLPSGIAKADTTFSNVPIIRFGESQLQLSQSRELALKKSFLPRVNLWATGFARGSAYQYDGSMKTWDGFNLSRLNYGAGLQVAFPIMKYGEVKKQLQQQQFLTKAAQENIEEYKSSLNTQLGIATITFDNSMAVARETQQQLKSGQYAFSAMQTRYNTGLVNFADLIQSQYNLLRAELDVKKAYWDAWKALLLKAAVNGDENIFLNQVK